MDKTARPELDKRKAFILATVVYEYVATAEPVGSQTLTQKYNLGVSSATVRNDMAELEAGGYLVQPHTSAGRVPSDAGYRTYVDRLMPPQTLTTQEQFRIRDDLRATSSVLEEMIEQTTRLLGDLAHSVAFAVAPARDSQIFRHLQLIWLASRTGLAVVVTSVGVATQHRFEFSLELSPDDFTRLSNMINQRFGGKTLREAISADLAATLREAGLPNELIDVLRDALQSAIAPEDLIVASSGAQNLLDQPEFQDLRKLRSILRILEEQKTLADLVAESIHAQGPVIKIGAELRIVDMAECSIVTVPYNAGGSLTGVLAILGPRRMEYARALALAAGTAHNLNRRIDATELS
jgi:heat-inducible transcriptional repressor